ncbi:Purkinje cell protein 4 [Liparis tanakae]|uniref:Purkinje cell protein 4 n=1 Tax=Liparis tanakae TaxID=230148 RepID=A0A4Z2HVA6_9TELE|nr:Purkinje cell protein 4 [Liparis tanakae]
MKQGHTEEDKEGGRRERETIAVEHEEQDHGQAELSGGIRCLLWDHQLFHKNVRLVSLPHELADDRQGSGAAAGNNKTSAEQDASKMDVPEDFDIDMENPETEKAAVAIQSQFRKFQKKKRVEKS